MKHEKDTFVFAFTSHLFLSELHFSLYASIVPVYTHMFGICRSGNKETRSVQRALPCHTPPVAVPSVGRFGIRPCSLVIHYRGFLILHSSFIMMCFDVHTHHLSACPSEAIFNADSKYIPLPDEAMWLSVGIHPWYLTSENYPMQLRWIESVLGKDKRVIALGEAGLDKCCHAPFSLQEEAFRMIVSLSEHYSLPLVIHAVKVYNELIALKKEIHPSQPWIVHGFRGKKELAQSLVRQGFYLSFGEHYHADALRYMPEGTFLLETDESRVPIHTLYHRAAEIRGIHPELLADNVSWTVNSLFFNR